MNRYKQLFKESASAYEIKKVCHFITKNFHTAFIVIGGAAYSLYTGISSKDLDIVVYQYNKLTLDSLSPEEIIAVDYDGRPTSIKLFGVEIDLLRPGQQYRTTSGLSFEIPYRFNNTRIIDGIEVMNEIDLMNISYKDTVEKFYALIKSLNLPKETIRLLKKGGTQQISFIDAYNKAHNLHWSDEEWKQIIHKR